MRRGAGIVGVDLTTAIHVIWDAPATDGGQSVSEYRLRVRDPNDVIAPTVITLAPPDFAGPAQGYFASAFNGAPLLPGQAVSFDVAACNGGGYPGSGASGCGPYSQPPVTLQTSNSTPGSVATPTITAVAADQVTLRIDGASYEGGTPITQYQLRIFTLPAALPEQILSLGPSAPASYTLTDRQSNLNYAFEARAVNAEGAGAWSETLWVQSALNSAEQANTPQNLALVSTTGTSFRLSWTMPDNNRSADVIQYAVQLQDVLTTELTLVNLEFLT